MNDNLINGSNTNLNNNVRTSVNTNVSGNVNASGDTNIGTNVNVTGTQVVANGQDGDKNFKKFYIWAFVSVGFILLIAIILLVLLLTGNIGSRNRLYCSTTTKEAGYTYTIDRIYVFDNKIMKSVYYTYTFEYDGEFTDEMYNQTFDSIINNDSHGSTKYGFGTKISKDGNVVKITANEPSYWKETYNQIKDTNKEEGYSCR